MRSFRPFDVLLGATKRQRDLGELGELYSRMQTYVGEAEDQRDEFCWKVVEFVFDFMGADSRGVVGKAAYKLCQDLLAFEGHFYLPEIDINRERTIAQMWELTTAIKIALVPFEQNDKRDNILSGLATLLKFFTDGLPHITDPKEDDWASLSVPLYVFLSERLFEKFRLP